MTTAHLATIPSRESLLKTVLESITPYVDHTFVALNDYPHTPDFLRDMNTVTVRHFIGDKGDANKFAFINEVSGRVLITDDDLVWTPNAINLLIQKITPSRKHQNISYMNHIRICQFIGLGYL